MFISLASVSTKFQLIKQEFRA